mgnify:CR=1 FL=1
MKIGTSKRDDPQLYAFAKQEYRTAEMVRRSSGCPGAPIVPPLNIVWVLILAGTTSYSSVILHQRIRRQWWRRGLVYWWFVQLLHRKWCALNWRNLIWQMQVDSQALGTGAASWRRSLFTHSFCWLTLWDLMATSDADRGTWSDYTIPDRLKRVLH